jgi:hypothetical protein
MDHFVRVFAVQSLLRLLQLLQIVMMKFYQDPQVAAVIFDLGHTLLSQLLLPPWMNQMMVHRIELEEAEQLQ